MNSLSKLALACAVLFFTLSFNTLAQQKAGQSLQKQLVGQWSLASFEMTDAKGAKGPGVEGADPRGLLIFTDNGRFSFVVMSLLPKLTKDRLLTTPEENKAVAHGVLAYFGTYSVNEADKTFSFKIERSSNPNQNGTDAKRIIQSLTADDLKFTNPARIGSSGGQTNLAWKRIK